MGEEESSGGVVLRLRGQPRSARWGPAQQAGAQAAAASPPPGAAEGPLMPTPGVGGSRLAAGAAGVAAVASARWRWGGRAGRRDTSPTPPPRGAAAATELLGLIQVRRWGRGRRGCLSCCLSCCCPCRRRSRGRGPHPTPPQSGGGGQNEASCGPASCRRACSGPAPGAGRRGGFWLRPPSTPPPQPF